MENKLGDLSAQYPEETIWIVMRTLNQPVSDFLKCQEISIFQQFANVGGFTPPIENKNKLLHHNDIP